MGMNTLYQAGRSRILMMLAIIAVAATALLAVTAQAAPKMPDASISIAGTAQARAAAADAGDIMYGSYVEFDYTLNAKMGKNNYLTINVECVQGDEVVYKRSGQTTQSFHMYAQGGNVYDWDGQRADCTARLRYYANHRLNIVAQTTFVVAP